MGTLFYVVGASGVGKDTLLNFVKNNIPTGEKVLFAHRYITRDAFSGGENHIELSKTDFVIRKESGLFALDWESHDNFYGIGIEVVNWLNAGFNVVANGSREYLPIAKTIMPSLIEILIDADSSIIESRLANRNRETHLEIKKRISRNLYIQNEHYKYVVLNNGNIEDAGKELLKIITSNVGFYCLKSP
jgi:ribose 1,5-bisphosphokinase